MEQSYTQNYACLPSDLFILGNLPLPPDIQLEQDAALSSANCGISGFDPLEILAECVDTIYMVLLLIQIQIRGLSSFRNF